VFCSLLIAISFSTIAKYLKFTYVFIIKPTRCTNFTNLFLRETCRVSCQNKFVKLVYLVGFIIKKCVTMRGHMNVK